MHNIVAAKASRSLVARHVAGMREVTQCYLAWREDEAGRAHTADADATAFATSDD